MDQAATQMLPRWKSHKIVEGAKIEGIIHNGDERHLKLVDRHGKLVRFLEVSREYMEKHNPQVGGYYVRYEDGYESWSPADAFENGYTPVGDAEAAFIRTVARICHEANRLYCLGLGDTSQPHWDEAPDWQRESAVAGVLFHMEHPGAPASLSHDEWVKHKLADGWRYGPKKDPEKKEHPCMVPFEELPPEQQFKGHLFSGIVNAAFAAQ